MRSYHIAPIYTKHPLEEIKHISQSISLAPMGFIFGAIVIKKNYTKLHKENTKLLMSQPDEIIAVSLLQ